MDTELWLGVRIDDRAASFALRIGDLTALMGEAAMVSELRRRRIRGLDAVVVDWP